MLDDLDVGFILCITMKKQTVDSISKQKQVELRKLAQQIFADQLEREQSDKLWLYLSYGLGLFVIGYMAYHFIRFLMM